MQIFPISPIASLAKTDGNFIIADGTNWAAVAGDTDTARTYLGLGTGDSPTFAGLTVVNAMDEFSTDGTLGGDSDTAIPTEKAVKAYVDGAGGGTLDHSLLSNLDFASAGHTGFQAQGDVLDDLNTLGANSADSEFLVGTGAGALAWESGATVRTSLGLGTGDSPTLTALTLTGDGLHLIDTDDSHDLILASGSDLSADRTLSIGMSDADRTLTMAANLTVSGNTILDQNLRTSDSPSFNELTLTTGTEDYLFTSRAGGVLVLQAQTSNHISFLNMMTTDGDANDDCGYQAWGYGTPGTLSPGELITMGWDSALSAYVVRTQTVGAGTPPTSRPLILYTQGQSNQLNLAIDGTVGIGAAPSLAKLEVVQGSATAAIPTLYLDQSDVSEEMMQFNTTIGVGNAIEAVGGKTLTTTHFIKVTLPGALTRYIPAGTIA